MRYFPFRQIFARINPDQLTLMFVPALLGPRPRRGADQLFMKTGIHPDYQVITVACACGNSFEVGSTHKTNMRVEICANCHPLYTGNSNLIDTAGRVDKFQARQAAAAKAKEDAAKRAAGKSAKKTQE